jgi:DNA (cytosine-5)-methyltransferase 1
LLTGGFPCQAFSMMGHQKGFGEDRGQMFFRIVDILETLKDRKPKYLLLENVKNLYTHDNKRTYRVIREKLEDLGYQVYDDIFNTADFHLPQKRNRLYIFATTVTPQNGVLFNFSAPVIADYFNSRIEKFSGLKHKTVLEILEEEVDKKYYLSERIKPTILSDGSKGYKSNSEINQVIARPLTATMHKMHRACQDNYYSQDFIESKGVINVAKSATKEELLRMPIRRITPEEAFMIQGFPKEFVEKARDAGVSDGALYKQAGNAVSVNIIYAIMLYLIENKIITE